MKKYYIEIVDLGGVEPYEVQSRWFDTKEQALEWAKTIDYCRWTVCLMSAVFTKDTDEYEVEFEGYLN